MLSQKKNLYNSIIPILSSWISCFILSILSVLIYFVLFSVVYEQNDDFWMRSIANGYFTGKPDFHLVYENNLIGYLLSFLYTNFQNVEWYALYMISALLISFFSNLYSILKYEIRINRFILTLANIFLIYFLSRLQFSYVSGFLAVSAILAQYYGDKKGDIKLLFFSIFLMLLSSAIRFEMFLFTYIPFFAVFIFNFKKILQYKIVYIGLVLVVGAKLFHNYQYSSEKKWSDYYEFNKARQSIIANSNIDFGNKEGNKKLNISEKDVALAAKFIFTEKLKLEKLKEISKENKTPVSISTILNFCFSYTKPYFIALCVFLILTLIFKNYKIALLISLHFIFVIFTMRYVNNVQYRILYPTLFGILFFFLKDFKYSNKPFLIAINTSVVGFFLLFAFRDANHTKWFALRTLDNIRTLEKQLSKNKTYLVDTTSNSLIYSRLAFQKPQINTLFFGWITNLPTIKEQYSSYNSNPFEMRNYPLLISGENFRNLKHYINNKEVYVIENYKTIKIIKQSK